MPTRCEICDCKNREVILTGRDRQHGVPGSWDLARCQGCGLVQMEPMPALSDIGGFYPTSEYYAHRASKSTFRNKRISGLKRFVLRTGYGHPPSKGTNLFGFVAGRIAGTFVSGKHLLTWQGEGKLLDVGCGVGSALWRLREMGWDVQGVEPDAEAGKIGREHGLPIITGTLEDAHFEDDAFDLIRLSHVLEHTPSPLSTLREIHRVLRPDGRLILTVPNIDSFLFKRLGADWFPLELPRHLFHFSPNTLRELCKKAGLELQHVRYTSTAEMFLRSWHYRSETKAQAHGQKPLGTKPRRRPWLKKLLAPAARLGDLCRAGEIMECTFIPTR